MREAPRYISVGSLGRAHGVAGEVRVEVETDVPGQRFAPGASVLIGRSADGDLRPARVVTSRPHKAWLLVRFDIANTRDQARALTGQEAFIPLAEAHDLEEGEYYVHELLGLTVRTVSGEIVGVVRSFIETGSADVLVISADGSDKLIPLTAEVVDHVDLEAGEMAIHPLTGLLD